MDRIKKEILEKLFGKLIDEKKLTILGFKDKLSFEIYDGFAYCPNYRGSEYCLDFPKIEFVNKSSEMQDRIRERMNLDSNEDITIIDVMATFNEMRRNGVRVEYDKEKNAYKEKCMWK